MPIMIIASFLWGSVDVLSDLFPRASRTLLLLCTFLFLAVLGYVFSRHSSRVALGIFGHSRHSQGKLKNMRLLFVHFVKSILWRDQVFEEAVWVTESGSRVRKIGFVTKHALHAYGMSDYACVFIPGAFSFQGEVVFIPRQELIPITRPKEEVLLLAISAGLALPEHEHHKIRKRV